MSSADRSPNLFAPAGSGPDALRRLLQLVGRFSLLVAAGFVLWSGLEIFPATPTSDWAVAAILCLYLLAFALLGCAFVATDPLSMRVQRFALGALVFAIFAVSVYHIRVTTPTYGTDAIAFTHAATETLLDGDNPYTVRGISLDPVIERFKIPFVTQKLDGSRYDRLVAYPAGSFLTLAPFVALGLNDVRWANLAFELATLIFIWWAMPSALRIFVPFAFLAERNLGVYFTTGGGTDWPWVLFLAVGAYFLHRQNWWRAGFLFGLACATKQQPWFVVPFALIWVAHYSALPGWRAMARALGACVGGMAVTFAALNLPFFLWSPSDWLSGVLAPGIENLTPDGQGLSVLSNTGLVSWPQGFYSGLMIATFGALMLAYFVFFERLRNALWVLPAVALWVSYRSLHNYFIFWLPLAALWIGLRYREFLDPAYARYRSIGAHMTPMLETALVSAAAAVIVGGAFLAGASAGDQRNVRLDVVSVEIPGGSGAIVSALDVTVRNRTPIELPLVFAVNAGGFLPPWRVADGDSLLRPNETRVFRIEAPRIEAIPAVQQLSDGSLGPVPFIVRVNVSNSSAFASSKTIELTGARPAIVNPLFANWPGADSPSALAQSQPLGWTPIRTLNEQATGGLAPLEGGQGVVLKVQNTERAPTEWAEVSLFQLSRQPSHCYLLEWRSDSPYDARGNNPVAAAGLQIIQGPLSVWFVPSQLVTEQLTDFPPNSRIVQLPARLGEWEQTLIRASAYAEPLGVDFSKEFYLKVFAQAHRLHGPEDVSLSVRSLRAAPCEATSAG